MVNIPGVPNVRLKVWSSFYVVAVALIAAVGFTEQSPWPVLLAALLAALLAVPSSIVALPLYYLAWLPGLDPRSETVEQFRVFDVRSRWKHAHIRQYRDARSLVHDHHLCPRDPHPDRRCVCQRPSSPGTHCSETKQDTGDHPVLAAR